MYNSSLPSSRLPPHILARIFEMACSDRYPRSPVRIASVSSLWRRVALSTGSLWALLRYTDLAKDKGHADLFLERSGSTPLRILHSDTDNPTPKTDTAYTAGEIVLPMATMYLGDSDDDDNINGIFWPMSVEPRQKKKAAPTYTLELGALEKCRSHLSHIQTLQLPCPLDKLPQAHWIFSTPAPILQNLDVRSEDIQSDPVFPTLFGNDLQLLRSLTMRNCLLPLNAPVYWKLRELKILFHGFILPNHPFLPAGAELLDLVRASPQLHTLSVILPLDASMLPSPPFTPSARFSLRITGTIPLKYLRNLTLELPIAEAAYILDAISIPDTGVTLRVKCASRRASTAYIDDFLSPRCLPSSLFERLHTLTVPFECGTTLEGEGLAQGGTPYNLRVEIVGEDICLTSKLLQHYNMPLLRSLSVTSGPRQQVVWKESFRSGWDRALLELTTLIRRSPHLTSITFCFIWPKFHQCTPEPIFSALAAALSTSASTAPALPPISKIIFIGEGGIVSTWKAFIPGIIPLLQLLAHSLQIVKFHHVKLSEVNETDAVKFVDELASLEIKNLWWDDGLKFKLKGWPSPPSAKDIWLRKTPPGVR